MAEVPKDTAPATDPETSRRRRSLRFIILMGLVSLLADVTYEGARSITGPFLGLLGAKAAWIGIVAGAGELVGYGLRFVFGYLSDRTGRYWAIAILGYTVNLLAVPALALCDRWDLAAALIVAERLGKAVRTPARDAMLSHATGEVGRGWGFGLHEALDQTGAVLGPLLMGLVLFIKGDYRLAFALLAIPAVAAIALVLLARLLYRSPRDMERSPAREKGPFPRAFWFYLPAVGLIAAGYIDYPLIAYHFGTGRDVAPRWIPLFYALAMAADAVAALVFGRLFDKKGLGILALSVVTSSLFAPLVMLGGFWAAALGMTLWGIGMGAQESIMRAAVADMAPLERRGTAYGIFNGVYGLCWFAGSAAMGYLYDFSPLAAASLSLALQLCSLPWLMAVGRVSRRGFKRR
ncbi:MAG TPA: MFS transporter [Syntrophales bacterium]|nr:MFS transporter [Syntrophales bacterium]HOM06822.1 MFS transporter [Syntrophales bacterium]HON99483.1 MFS transporter [Syntrophales bacterium]HPC00782.1 MFS transporter [Syntrophales bacterium]HPQ06020.1 MFS transporter [Syntrophales bacterium]